MPRTQARLVLTVFVAFVIAEAFKPSVRESVVVEQDDEVLVEPRDHVLISVASVEVAPDPMDPADLQSLSQIAQLGINNSNHLPEIGQNELLAVRLILMIVLCIIALAAYFYMDRILQTPRTVLLANGCVFLYVVATITADIVMQKLHMRSGGNAYNFHPSVMVFLAEFGKLVLNSLLAMADYQQTRLCSQTEFFGTVRIMMIPAACFFTLNLLRYHALANADLSEYRVFRSLDVVIVAVLWCVVFKRTLKVHEMLGVGLVTLSCVCLGMRSSILSGNVSRGWISAIVIFMAFVSSIGMVTNEMGFRSLPDLSLFTQNCTLLVVTCTFSLLYVFASVPVDAVLHGLDRFAVALLILEVLLGMCVSCVLKYANAVVKQLATGWITPLEPLIGHCLVGTTLTPMSVGCTLIAGLGNVIYRMESAEEWGRGWKVRLCGDGGRQRPDKDRAINRASDAEVCSGS